MKKFLTMLLALVMVLSLAACSSQKGGDVNGGSNINLPSLTDLLLHKGISLRPVRSIHHTIFNGKSLRRKFINY